MKIGLIIYGRLDTLTGGYLYDRQMVAALKRRGHRVVVLSLPSLNYFRRWALNFQAPTLAAWVPEGLDLLLQDVGLHPRRYINVSVFGGKDAGYELPAEDPAFPTPTRH